MLPNHSSGIIITYLTLDKINIPFTLQEEYNELLNNAELVTIGHRRRPQLIVPADLQLHEPEISTAPTNESAAANADIPLPAHHISSSVQLHDPYKGFIVLSEHCVMATEPMTREPIADYGTAVYNAAVCGLGSTIAFNMSAEDFAPMELCN